MKKIFLAIPTTGTVADSQVHFLRQITERYKDEVELVYPKSCIRRVFHDFARNALAEEFLESDCDAMWFLDSDVTPPVHVLDLVTLHWDKWKLAGAPYPVFMSPKPDADLEIVFTVYKRAADGMHPTKIPYSGTEEVDGVATGCMFIKREVLEKMERPYFEFKYEPISRFIIEGEDIGFCRKANDLGYKVFVDYGMPCKHTKTVDLLDLNNYAIAYANKAVQAYDAMIKGQIAELAAKLSMKKATEPKIEVVPGNTRWGK